jgi:RNA polymerase sigma-70 factor (ECF subfamily)
VGEHAPVSAATLARARSGDEDAFRELVGPHVRELHLHCYRMLGSLTDAEDLLQETMTAAWRGLDGFAGRSSLRTWLYRIATNRCLNAIRAAKRRPPPEPEPPFRPPAPSRMSEVTWLQPYPDVWLEKAADTAPGPAARYQSREAIELAFIAALQRLPPRQTAAVVLCDVLGFAINEVAGFLDVSPTSVKGILQRGRATLDQRRTTGTAAAPAGSDEERRLAGRFADAFSADDIDGVVALLTEQAWLVMPPAPHEYDGREAIATFLRASAAWRRQRRFRMVATRANTQPAFGCYLDDPDGPGAHFAGVVVVTTTVDRISGVTRFLDGRLHRYFGLPGVLDGLESIPLLAGRRPTGPGPAELWVRSMRLAE